jgi:hypothetical protein
MASLDTFKYDESLTFDQNFISWYQMNCTEKRVYSEELYSENEGRSVFESMYKDQKQRQI